MKNGSQIFIPTQESRLKGEKLVRRIRSRWPSPSYYYHLMSGGHIKALSIHLGSEYFIKTDIYKFFDHVSRTKIHRALKSLEFFTQTVFKWEAESTVEKRGGEHKYSLPFGFPQSPILASLVLYYSALGRYLDKLTEEQIKVLLFMDDIILSTERSVEKLCDAFQDLEFSAQRAGFKLNLDKTFGPSTVVTAFNIELSHKKMKITDERLARFREQFRIAENAERSGIEGYIRSVNVDQAKYFSDDGVDTWPIVTSGTG